jgi:pimeloyl-ACP methyl ester carboxylesterase
MPSHGDPQRTGEGAQHQGGHMEQEIRFCTASDGVRIAYATMGQGPPLVKAANWLSHLEYDLESPVWSHWLHELSRDHTLIRYDERGCGLSEWDVEDHSHDAWVKDLEAVVDAAGLTRFALMGISQGGPVAIAFAAQHPECVSQLVLYGTYARGWERRGASAEEIAEREAAITLSEHGWGRDVPAYREMFTRTFIPDANDEQRNWFNELQRVTCSPTNAVRLQRALGPIDVSHLLPKITVPTLVLHARGDMRCPFDEARRIASAIPDSRFVSLNSRNHLLLEGEPAWYSFLHEVRLFLGVSTDAPQHHESEPSRAPDAGFTHRPRQGVANIVGEQRSVFQSLKERKLVQWTVGYLTAAWVALQIAGEVREPWGLPDWFLRATQVLLFAGFLLTGVLAWYHGEKGHQRPTALELAIIASLLAGVAVALSFVIR